MEKIEAIELRLLSYPLDIPFQPSWAPPRKEYKVTLVELKSTSNITGVGATVGMYGEEMISALSKLSPDIIGLDCFNLEALHNRLSGLTIHGINRPWFVENACWDLIGKICKQPVYKLMGYDQRELKAYASLAEIRTSKERVEQINRLIDEGFKAVKLRLPRESVQECIKYVSEIMENVDVSKCTIMVDANRGWMGFGRIDPSWTINDAFTVARSLEEMGVFYLEEPLFRYNYSGLHELKMNTKILIAGGELNEQFHEFLNLVENDVLDIYQPDALFSGGIRKLIKVAPLVLAKGKLFTPHAWNSGAGFSANLHVANCFANTFFEFPYDPPSWTPEIRDFMLEKPFKPDKRGVITAPERPGLGIALDKDIIEKTTVLKWQSKK